MQNDSYPKLSDLVKDWAEKEGWPITISPSVQFPMLCWIESRQKIVLDKEGNSCSAYFGTIHNDDAYFSPHSDVKDNYIDAADPEFFEKMSYVIFQRFRSYPQLDKRTLPQEWQWQDEGQPHSS